MVTTDPALYRGHSPELDLDFLLTIYPDGHHELATRRQPQWSWSAPVVLSAVEVTA